MNAELLKVISTFVFCYLVLIEFHLAHGLGIGLNHNSLFTNLLCSSFSCNYYLKNIFNDVYLLRRMQERRSMWLMEASGGSGLIPSVALMEWKQSASHWKWSRNRSATTLRSTRFESFAPSPCADNHPMTTPLPRSNPNISKSKRHRSLCLYYYCASI